MRYRVPVLLNGRRYLFHLRLQRLDFLLQFVALLLRQPKFSGEAINPTLKPFRFLLFPRLGFSLFRFGFHLGFRFRFFL